MLGSLPRGSSVTNVAANNATTEDRHTANSTEALFVPGAICCLWEITNDLFFNQDKVAAMTEFWDWCDDVRAQGFRVVVGTVIPMWENGEVYEDHEADRQYCNTRIRSEWQSHADALADVAALSYIGDPGAYTNTTYWQADGTHLTVAGNALVATVFGAAVLSIG